jgi:hypothetical protein
MRKSDILEMISTLRTGSMKGKMNILATVKLIYRHKTISLIDRYPKRILETKDEVLIFLTNQSINHHIDNILRREEFIGLIRNGVGCIPDLESRKSHISHLLRHILIGDDCLILFKRKQLGIRL